MAAHKHMTRAERVMRDFQAKQRLLTSRPDVLIEPAELRELMAAADQALEELTDIKQRCLADEAAAKTNHRASSPLVGRQGGGVRRRAMRRAEANQFRATTSSIDRSMTDLRKLQASLRPTEIDLRDEQPRQPINGNTETSLPPPPARLGTIATPRRSATEHERAMFQWLASSLHHVIATQPRQEWPPVGRNLLASYGDERQGLAPQETELQSRLLNATRALVDQDETRAINELTAAYKITRQLPQPASQHV